MPKVKIDRSRIVRVIPPSKVLEKRFVVQIVYMVNEIGERFKNNVFAKLSKKTISNFTDERKGVFSKQFLQLAKYWSEKLVDQFSGDRIATLVAKCMSGIDSRSKKSLCEELEKAIGIDTSGILKDEGVKDTISSMRIETEVWISKLRDETLQLITADSLRAMSEGKSLHEVLKTFNADIDKKKFSARTVARTQISTYNALTLKARALNLGITEGIWRTSLDERVRRSHFDRDGKVFDLKKGLYSSIDDKFLLPGIDINCRCTTELLLPIE